MRMTKINLSLGLALLASVAACSLATDMDATLEREVENAAELRHEAQKPM